MVYPSDDQAVQMIHAIDQWLKQKGVPRGLLLDTSVPEGTKEGILEYYQYIIEALQGKSFYGEWSCGKTHIDKLLFHADEMYEEWVWVFPYASGVGRDLELTKSLNEELNKIVQKN